MKFFIFIYLCFSISYCCNAQESRIPSQLIRLDYIKTSPSLLSIKLIAPSFNFSEKKSLQEDDDRKSVSFSNENFAGNVDSAQQTEYNTDETNCSSKVHVISNWAGPQSKFLRSDNNIAVGKNHIIELVNSDNNYSSIIQVWNKAGKVLVDHVFVKELTGVSDYGDPNIIYDQQANRFIATFLYSGSAKKLIIIASKTEDPMGEWYVYTFDTPSRFPDYEKVAVWGDSYFITVANGTAPAIYVLNRQDILSAKTSNPVLKFIPSAIPNIGWQALSPVNVIGKNKIPVNEPAVLMRVIDDAWDTSLYKHDRMEIFSLTINWNNPQKSFLSQPLVIPIPQYNSNLCGFNSNRCLPQKNSDVKLWPVSDFITDKAQYRNFENYASIVGSHVCNADGNGTAEVRWYELRKYPEGNWFIYQQSTYMPTKDDRWISSVTINQQGTIALGYNITGKNLYPGIRVTGRLQTDKLNKMTAPEKIIKDGLAANYTLDYGDYNGIVTDPVDDSFWFAAQWNKTTKWSTNIVHFTIDPNNVPVTYSKKSKK